MGGYSGGRRPRETVQGGDEMSLDRVIRKKELLPFIGLSDVTIWRMERAGKFPRRIRLGGNSVGWYESEIIEWQEQKKAERAG